ncbi:MAG: hypothetical protein HFI33_11480 [Lachnospiraceae bacterium]|nr:hypothetical protein [Lachnospiraceae bacterium]
MNEKERKKRRGRGRSHGIAAWLLGLLLIALLTGCGGQEEAVAVLNGENISLSEAVFYTRLNQQQWEQAYAETFGMDFWTQTLHAETGTFAQELKRQVMDTICQIHLMNAHAEEYGVSLSKEEEKEIAGRVQDFMDTHSKEVREAAGADKKLVKELLRQRMLADKVAEAMVADYEPQVSHEEAALGKMTYCLFSTLGTYDTEGNHQGVTTEERKVIEEEANSFAQRCGELGDINAAAQEAGRTCIDVFFNDNTDGGVHEKVAALVRTLEQGQCAGPVSTEEGYYVVQYISALDEEATARNQEALIQQKKALRCQEMYEAWLEEADFTIVQEVWDTIQVTEIQFLGDSEG